MPSATSPPEAEVCSRASSWLYSTLMTSGRSPGLVGTNLQIAPAASPGERGTCLGLGLSFGFGSGSGSGSGSFSGSGSGSG